MKKIIFIILINFISFGLYAQNRGDFFSNQDCEYIHFENDSIIEFLLFGDISGALAKLYKGIGIYKIEGKNLTVKIIDSTAFKSVFKAPNNKQQCNENINKTEGLDKYIIEKLANGNINLIGPILENYKKLNKHRQYFVGLWNWPWNWNFHEQHWYDPRHRMLNK